MENEPTLASLSLSIRDCKDTLDSLHHRMDRFYSWASQLQVEHRDLRQRTGFIEGVVLHGEDLSVCGSRKMESQIHRDT